MYWFENNDNEYEMIVEDPFTCEDRTIAKVFYDDEEQTWAWANSDISYYGFETAEEAQADCKRTMCSVPEYDYDDV